jgi:hypothetical protein
MTVERYQRFDLAANQLETAIGLYIGGHDKFSVITLAAAADGILSELVNRKGEKTFIEGLAEKDGDEDTATRSGMGRHVNQILFINALKHMDDGEDGYVFMDVDQCALAAILKAIVNCVTLRGRGVDFIEAFLLWVKLNLDPKIYNVECDPDWKSRTST